MRKASTQPYNDTTISLISSNGRFNFRNYDACGKRKWQTQSQINNRKACSGLESIKNKVSFFFKTPENNEPIFMKKLRPVRKNHKEIIKIF